MVRCYLEISAGLSEGSCIDREYIMLTELLDEVSFINVLASLDLSSS